LEFSLINKDFFDLILLVPSDVVLLGCLKEIDRIHQYIIPNIFDNWQSCREECYHRGMKV
jgi:hypothetical protein